MQRAGVDSEEGFQLSQSYLQTRARERKTAPPQERISAGTHLDCCLAPIMFWISRQSFSMQPWLTWNSLCRLEQTIWTRFLHSLLSPPWHPVFIYQLAKTFLLFLSQNLLLMLKSRPLVAQAHSGEEPLRLFSLPAVLMCPTFLKHHQALLNGLLTVVMW